MFLKRRHTTAHDPVHLMRQYRVTGELRLLGELYEPQMEFVFAICYKYLQDTDEAKDAVMQIFEQLIDDLRTHDVQNFKNWLHTVTRNYCLMQLRHRKITTTTAGIDEDTDMENEPFLHLSDSADDLDWENQLQKLENCVAQLNEAQRTTVQLFFWESLSYQQIAENTGFEINQVKSFLQNGKRNVKICVENHGKKA